MKNLKLSNKLIPLITIFFFFSTQINSNEAVDIWNLNKDNSYLKINYKNFRK